MMEALMYLQVRMDGWKFRFVGDCQVSHYQFFTGYLLYAGDEVLPSHIRIIYIYITGLCVVIHK